MSFILNHFLQFAKLKASDNDAFAGVRFRGVDSIGVDSIAS
ncbi:hypothetical protein PALB_8890 [Pseudoalteromonas luteoviolacea B = ATCC 29581]|nr:hypothetical protein PALB_8890 [Pseudoalteromonas luteoviolacea B = ATCC 29581]